MRVMISQPMRGLSADQIRENRAAVVAALEAEGHEVVDTVFTETPPENGNQALWCLGKALQVMSTVDAVYFMDGWERARGCRVEYEACRRYPLGILNVNPLELAHENYRAIGQKSFVGMADLKTVEDYEAFFTDLVKDNYPSIFWEHMKDRPIMEIVAALLDQASITLRENTGILESRCEVCGKLLTDAMYGGTYREDIEIEDPETGDKFSITGNIVHNRCLEHRTDLKKLYGIKKQYMSFEDLTQLVFYAKRVDREHVRKYLIAAMKNCIAGLEKQSDACSSEHTTTQEIHKEG